MKDLINLGIQIVEKLELNRKKYAKNHALYMITPTEESINLLIKDFVNEENKIQYHKIHIFFMSKLSKDLLLKLKQEKTLLDRIATIKEFNHDFYFFE